MKKIICFLLLFCAMKCYAQSAIKQDSINVLKPDRKIIRQSKINTNIQNAGKVAVNITVDADGNVTEATYNKALSTTSDTFLVNLSIKDAYQLKYEKSAKPIEKGHVVFTFKPLNK